MWAGWIRPAASRSWGTSRCRGPAGWALGRIRTAWETFTLDATVFEHRGQRYLAWAQTDPAKKNHSTDIFLPRSLDLHVMRWLEDMPPVPAIERAGR